MRGVKFSPRLTILSGLFNGNNSWYFQSVSFRSCSVSFLSAFAIAGRSYFTMIGALSSDKPIGLECG